MEPHKQQAVAKLFKQKEKSAGISAPNLCYDLWQELSTCTSWQIVIPQVTKRIRYGMLHSTYTKE